MTSTPLIFSVVVHLSSLRYGEHVVAAMQHEIRTLHMLKMSFERKISRFHHRFLHAPAPKTHLMCSARPCSSVALPHKSATLQIAP